MVKQADDRELSRNVKITPGDARRLIGFSNCIGFVVIIAFALIAHSIYNELQILTAVTRTRELCEEFVFDDETADEMQRMLLLNGYDSRLVGDNVECRIQATPGILFLSMEVTVGATIRLDNGTAEDFRVYTVGKAL